MESPPSCESCGACCAFVPDDERSYAPVTPDDLVTLERAGVARMVHRRDKAMRTVVVHGMTRCVALKGRVGMDSVGCSIYEHRPHVCRAVAPGDDLCLAARASLGI